MNLEFPASLIPAPPAAGLTTAALAVIIAGVRRIGAAELRILALYQEIERDDRQASIPAGIAR